jgi:hypothetical protein
VRRGVASGRNSSFPHVAHSKRWTRPGSLTSGISVTNRMDALHLSYCGAAPPFGHSDIDRLRCWQKHVVLPSVARNAESTMYENLFRLQMFRKGRSALVEEVAEIIHLPNREDADVPRSQAVGATAVDASGLR